MEALQGMVAEYEEARRESKGSDSCWGDSGVRCMGLMVGAVPMAVDGAVELGVQAVQEGHRVVVGAMQQRSQHHLRAAAEAPQAEEQDSSTPVLPPVLHQMWEAIKMRAYNGVLAGELQAEVHVDLLQEVEAKWMDDVWTMLTLQRRRWGCRVPYNLNAGHQHITNTIEEEDGEGGAR